MKTAHQTTETKTIRFWAPLSLKTEVSRFAPIDFFSNGVNIRAPFSRLSGRFSLFINIATSMMTRYAIRAYFHRPMAVQAALHANGLSGK
jgi:hypothetical protein